MAVLPLLGVGVPAAPRREEVFNVEVHARRRRARLRYRHHLVPASLLRVWKYGQYALYADVTY